ncbi:MAG: neutral/alkaline non-lysosomal ceramidase N-terminal domain-containing protein [Deltaproteobacteria bacterium]|nr:neutral/alkaline non-lysosomal ceramidase N-terminal domain-containing protein [Deltaproteobacteria bacterium]
MSVTRLGVAAIFLSSVMLVAVLGGCASQTVKKGDGGSDAVIGDMSPDQMSPDQMSPDQMLPDQQLVRDVASDVSAGLFLSAGAGSVDITPALGVPLGGFGGAPRRVFDWVTIPAHLAAIVGACYDPTPGDVAALFAPSTGKRDPLTAKALVLDNGRTKAAIVKVDAIGVSRKMRQDVEAVALSLGIPKENLIVAATHTHSGSGAVSNEMLWQIVAMDCFDPSTYATLLGGIVKALKQADAARRPAAFGVGSVDVLGVTRNRAGQAKVDPELGLFKVVDATTGDPIAALVNLAIHGTCFGSSNMKFSADVMGYIERDLEADLGAGIAIFTNGAEGDVAPAHGGESGAVTIGAKVATASGTLWKTIATRPTLEIEGSLALRAMPSPTVSGCMPLFGDGKSLCDYLGPVQLPVATWLPQALPFGALRLGDVALATIPGELVTELGLKLKAKGKALGFKHTFVVGLANEHVGYIATKAMFQDGTSYEAQTTLYGENMGLLVLDAAETRLKAVQSGPPSP